MGSPIQSSKVDLHRSTQGMRDHSGRRALEIEPDFELDGGCTGGCTGGHGGHIRLEETISC
jgi:hypothetical protein